MDLKQNSVLIFKNDKKNGESHPDYKGQIDVNGQLLDIALWVKEGKKGKFFSGKISEPYHRADPPSPSINYAENSMLNKEQIQDDPPTDESDLPFVVTILLAVGTLLPMLF
jgi:hypothetical protein